MSKETRDRIAFRMQPETRRRIEQWYAADNCQSMNEFVEKAVNFYVDHLEIQDNQTLLPITGLAAEGLGAAAEAVADELEEVRRATDAPAGRALQHKGADDLGVGRLEVDLRQIHLLLQVVVRELALGEEFIEDIEVIPRVQRQEAQAPPTVPWGGSSRSRTGW